MLVHVCHPDTQEAEAGESLPLQAQGQSRPRERERARKRERENLKELAMAPSRLTHLLLYELEPQTLPIFV